MAFPLNSNDQVYCWLRLMLEPEFEVLTLPEASYYSEHLFHYQIRRVCPAAGETSVTGSSDPVSELRGDFRRLSPGELVAAAERLVSELRPSGGTASSIRHTAVRRNAVRHSAVRRGSEERDQARPLTVNRTAVIASRLIPLRTDKTYFSSGRAAFTYLIRDVIRPRRVWLPTYVCWSLIATMEKMLSDVELCFYSVDRQLSCTWPAEVDAEDVVLFIHYFGKQSSLPTTRESIHHQESDYPGIRLEDLSHVLIPRTPVSGDYAFGSLRKTFPIADGGVIYGQHTPVYEADDGLISWLRTTARDWRDLREAENMMDRVWKMSDMSSGSMAVMLTRSVQEAADARRRNQRLLEQNLPAGTPLVTFADSEVPLLHNVVLPDRKTRDSLREFLAREGVFCSIHWPVHPVLRQRADEVDITDAIWLADHILSIPVADDFSEMQMTQICDVTARWYASGG